MYSYLFVSIIAILLPVFFSKEKNGIGLKLAFILLALFIGLRYNYGNDTKSYMELFNQINSLGIGVLNVSELIQALPYEPGWLILNNVFGFLGWQVLQFLIAAFECYVLYDFINTNVPRNYQWLSIAIFVFSSPFMFIGACSMMRQWLACIIFLFSLRYIKKHKILPIILCSLICISLHKSAVVVLPVLLLFCANKELLVNKLSVIITLSLLIIWYMSSGKVAPYLDVLLFESDNLTSYTTYQEAAGSVSFSVFGLLAVFVMPVFSLTQLEKFDREEVIFIYISLFSLLFLPLQTYSIMIGRLSIYFSVLTIGIYPLLLSKLPNRNKYIVIILILIILLPAIKDLFACFNSPTYKEAYGAYHSIIFS